MNDLMNTLDTLTDRIADRREELIQMEKDLTRDYVPFVIEAIASEFRDEYNFDRIEDLEDAKFFLIMAESRGHLAK